MTVCVATIANNGTIFGVADRMLTRGITQSEPKSPKIYHFNGPPPVSVMWAGSSTVFGEVIQDAVAVFDKTPNKFKTVRELVDVYCDCYASFLGKRAERAILARLGLTRQSLASNKVTNDRANMLIQQVVDYVPMMDEGVEVLIVGHDDWGAHIWRVVDSVAACHDVEGFAAIGIGADHADAQLRFAGYTKNANPQEATMMAFLAKKRAEVAPGVGRTTDMFVRNQNDRTWWAISDAWKEVFDQMHADVMRSEKAALDVAVRAAKEFLDETFKPQSELPLVGEATQLSPPESTHDQ